MRKFALIFALASLIVMASVAEADDSPRRVVLSYQSDISNWGPKGMTGIAELLYAEGEVRFTALGLPQLKDEVYVLWLKNGKTGEVLELGRLNANPQGEARFSQVLATVIPDRQWDQMLVTVEKAGSSLTRPGDRKALFGHVSGFETLVTAAPELPRTGDGGMIPGAGWLLAAAGFGAAAWEGLSRLIGRSRRRASMEREVSGI